MSNSSISQLVALQRLAGDPAMTRAASAYRVAVASRDDRLPTVEALLLEAAGAVGWASEVYAVTQRVRDDLGMPRRERMEPDGVGQPSPHPEPGETARFYVRLPRALQERAAAQAQAEGVSLAVWVADLMRQRLLALSLGGRRPPQT